MPIQSGISTDMTTTRGENAESPISFVEDPDAQEFSLSDYYSTHGNGPGMMTEYSNTMAENDDVNDLSLNDVWQGVTNVGKSVLQGVGLMDKDQPQPAKPHKTEEKPVEQNNKLPEQPKVTNRSQENIKAIQAYFQNPTPALRSFIGGNKYDGELDGKAGPKTRNIVSSLELALNQLFNTRRFSGMILSTSPQDINTALQKAAVYRKYKLQKSDIRAQSGSRDERFYKLGKKLISKR